MVTESELIQKRQEVRDEILALKEQIPSSRIFNWLGRAFKHNSLGYWLFDVVLLNLILMTPWILIGLVLKEIEKAIPVSKASLMAVEIIIPSIVVAHIAAQIMLDDVAKRVVEKISIANDLSKMLLWFKNTWSIRNVATFALPFSLLWGALGVAGMSVLLHQFVGFGLMLTAILVGLVAGIVFYVPIWTSFMIVSLKDYHYEMNTFFPADSEIISDISEILAKGMYILAVFFAVITLLATSSLVNQQLRVTFSLPVIVFGWTIIILQFLLTRSTLSTITNRAKWKTLNRIRDKINALEATGDLSDKDTAERLFRLADIHKQIMASKTNTLDLKSVSTLFSQLMLPLLGLLLGNLDKLLKLLP